MVGTWWGHLFELVHGTYALVIAPLFAAVFFGSALYFIANKRRDGWAALVIRGVGFLKHRGLRDHPAICAACGYPVAEGSQCPECGAAYSQPGAVLYREELQSRRLSVPRWLSLAAIALVLTFAAWLLAPAALLIGNKIEWGAYRVEEANYSPEYTPPATTGSPQYTVLLSTTFVIPTDPADPRGPLAGDVTFILTNPITKDLGWLNVQVADLTWKLHYYRGGIESPHFRPTSIKTGVGMDAGILELYKITGFDQYWSGSQAEIADLQRLGAISIGPDFRTIEDPSSLHATARALVWTSSTTRWNSGNAIKAWQPMPVSNTAGVLGIVVLSLPLIAAAGYIVIRFVRR